MAGSPGRRLHGGIPPLSAICPDPGRLPEVGGTRPGASGHCPESAQVHHQLRRKGVAQTASIRQPPPPAHRPLRCQGDLPDPVRSRSRERLCGGQARDRLGEQRRLQPALEACGVRLPVGALHREAPSRGHSRVRYGDPQGSSLQACRDPDPDGGGARLCGLRSRYHVQGCLPASLVLGTGAGRRGRRPGGSGSDLCPHRGEAERLCHQLRRLSDRGRAEDGDGEPGGHPGVRHREPGHGCALGQARPYCR